MNFFLKNKSFKTFNYVVLGIIFIVSITFATLLNHFFSNFFQSKLDKKLYYNSLYGNSDIGCSTIEYVDPEIIFIGDSTGYHSWDFNIFRNKTKKRIGTCFLQGFSILSIEYLLNFFEKNQIKPKFLILSNTYRIFLNENINQGFVHAHKKYLNDIENSKYQTKFKIISKYLINKNSFKITVPINKEIEKYIKNIENNKIDLMIDNIIFENKETSGFKNYSSLINKFNDDNFFFKEHKKFLNYLCKYISENNTKLILTNIPSTKIIKNLTKIKKRNNDKKVHEYLNKCTNSKIYFVNDLKDFEFKNKYFLLTNNKLDQYKKFKEYVMNLDDINYDVGFYDFNHMNRLGAQLFTKTWLKENEVLFKNENK